MYMSHREYVAQKMRVCFDLANGCFCCCWFPGGGVKFLNFCLPLLSYVIMRLEAFKIEASNKFKLQENERDHDEFVLQL